MTRLVITLSLILVWLAIFATPAYAWTKPMVAAGNYHTVGLKSDGTVLAVGYNDWGGANVSSWTNITAVAAGYDHSVGLKANGTVVAVTENDYGQTNVSSWTNITAVAAGAYHTVGLRSDGTVVAAGFNGSGQTNVSSWTGIVAIAAGYDHTVGLKADGTVVAVGRSVEGQTGVSSWSNITAIAAGKYHTVGLKADGTVVAAGLNNHGQTNVTSWTGISAIAAGWNHTVGLKANGTVVAVGQNASQTNVSSWTGVSAIAAGELHTVGLMADGSVRATGSNLYGQTGVASWQLGSLTPPAHAYSVTLQPSQIVLSFASVTDEGISGAITAVGDTAPSGLRTLSGGCWQISTSAAFSGNVNVTIPYNPSDLQGASEADVELYQYVSPGVWQRVTGSVNATSDTVTGSVTSMGIFAVMAPVVAPPVVSVPATSDWSLAIACVVGLSVVAMSRRRLHGQGE